MIETRLHSLRTVLALLFLTAAAICVHGYHPFSEDAEIYLPGVEKILHPELFPVGQEFFASHAHLTLFPNLIAFSLRVTHLPFETGLLLWHAAAIFLFLAACWQLTGVLFATVQARWAGVALVAALLTIPVAGTALYILDQYLNPRNLAAFAAVFAVTRVIEKKYFRALLWLVFAGSVHPLMAVFAVSLCFLLMVMEKMEGCGWGRASLDRTAEGGCRHTNAEATSFARRDSRGRLSPHKLAPFACLLPFGISLAPQASRAYHEAVTYHGFHYIQRWAWYEILGAVAPAVLLWWFAAIARQREWKELALLCRALVIYNLVYLAAALVVDFPERFEALARLQPLRSLHLLYILMFVIGGGFLGEFLLRNKPWRWLILLVPLCAGMFTAQRSLFPSSSNIELPGAAPRNDWAKAFIWIRESTPLDAMFALDPQYMRIVGEDSIGFRCLAQRSRLVDAVKDSGAVSMFPPLAETWWAQMQAQDGWKHFQSEDWVRLKMRYGVSWVMLENVVAGDSSGIGLDCPYHNPTVRVCQLR